MRNYKGPLVKHMKPTTFTFGRFIVVAILLLLLIGTAWGAIISWSSITGAPISLAGKIAFVIGVFATLALGCGLMALSYHSARSGRDEEAQYQPNKKRATDKPPPLQAYTRGSDV
jgi:hypothetical protein